MMDRDELTRRMIENDADTLRAERNAAQQRAAQAERERDEARAVVAMIHAMLREHPLTSNPVYTVNPNAPTVKAAAPQAQPAWTPMTGAEIAASIGDTPILPADFDIDAVDHSLDRSIAQQDTNHASLQLDYAISDMNDENNIDAVMHLIEATGHIIDVLRRMQKGGAS